jgi:hypothetical protein
MKTLIVRALLLLFAGSCASVSVEGLHPETNFKEGAFAVEFEFDRIHLADTIKTELRKKGYAVTDSRAEARYLWTGSYTSVYDAIHDAFISADFKIMDLSTNQTLCKLMNGGSGLSSCEAVVEQMTHRLSGWKPPEQQRQE